VHYDVDNMASQNQSDLDNIELQIESVVKSLQEVDKVLEQLIAENKTLNSSYSF
jgi:hypothetical protein